MGNSFGNGHEISQLKEADAQSSDAKIYFNGKQILPVDDIGNPVVPFAVNDSTYQHSHDDDMKHIDLTVLDNTVRFLLNCIE